MLANTSLRGGVSNVFNTEPPFLDDTRGGCTGVIASRGRTYTMQVSKRF